MKTVSKRPEERFSVINEEGKIERHRIDMGGNYFINGKCINPKRSDLVLYTDDVWRHPEIGDTYPEVNKLPSVIKVS